ncbi:MAG TPA: alpha/beta hydrolase, partial [Haliangium sp.]|nr:alpha/beta hydrolase [Haliangium sp.]
FEMHYVERGQGDETLVLVAGFISTQRWWRPILERLPAGFRAYALDMRAAGGSEQIESGHNVARYAADVHEFVEAMGLSRFVLVGHSMGGGVAMQYALDHQDRLKALILANPLAPYGMRIDQATTDWINSVQGQAAGQRMMLLGGHGTPPPEADLEELVTDAVAWGKAMYQGMMDDMARFDVSDRLNELNVPTLVTWGDRDRVIPFAGIMDVFTKISGCGLEVWHGVGHHLPRERPDWFVELLGRFAASRGSAATRADRQK